METKDNKHLEMLAYEAFIRRAAQVDLPFMLKGSYVTRQYFNNPNDRIPADLDWVYMEPIYDESTAREIFNEWATLVTELDLPDQVKFRSFKENEFWRRIDYAMADDFPTINTDLQCVVHGETLNLGLDISFNLDIEQAPVPMIYQPLEGEAFLLSYTVPLSLQVSWKIHQTLVRPRFKDLFDLTYLVQHPEFDTNNMYKALKALINECSADNVDLQKLKCFLDYEMEYLFANKSIEDNWAFWRHGTIKKPYDNDIMYEKASYITDETKLPNALPEFLAQFKNTMQHAGFGIYLYGDLPQPSRQKGRQNF